MTADPVTSHGNCMRPDPGWLRQKEVRSTAAKPLNSSLEVTVSGGDVTTP